MIYPVSGTNDEFNTIYTSKFRNLHKEWGTGINETHFIHMGDSGSNDDFNTGFIDDRFHFYMIGDIEIMSCSYNDNGIKDQEFSNIDNFHNRQLTKSGSSENNTYWSYVNTINPVDNKGVQYGKPIGRTAYFATSSDGGTLFYPSNHYINFANDFSNKQFRGTKYIGDRFFNLIEQEDYSSASFYRVKVSGEQSLRIVRGKNQTDSDGNINKM